MKNSMQKKDNDLRKYALCIESVGEIKKSLACTSILAKMRYSIIFHIQKIPKKNVLLQRTKGDRIMLASMPMEQFIYALKETKNLTSMMEMIIGKPQMAYTLNGTYHLLLMFCNYRQYSLSCTNYLPNNLCSN